MTRRALAADRCQIASCRAGMVCDVLHSRAWIHDMVRFYIPYYNRAAALPCIASGVAVVSGSGLGAALDGMPSSVAQVVHRRLVWLLYCVRWNGSNQRKSPCKAL